jgi:hypothetical protein
MTADVSVTIMMTPAWGVLLLSGFVVLGLLIVLGLRGRNAVMTGIGLLLAGVLVFATDLLIFLRTPPPLSAGYLLTSSDILLVGLLGFLGGALSMLGSSYLSLARRIAERPRDPGPFTKR